MRRRQPRCEPPHAARDGWRIQPRAPCIRCSGPLTSRLSRSAASSARAVASRGSSARKLSRTTRPGSLGIDGSPTTRTARLDVHHAAGLARMQPDRARRRDIDTGVDRRLVEGRGDVREIRPQPFRIVGRDRRRYPDGGLIRSGDAPCQSARRTSQVGGAEGADVVDPEADVGGGRTPQAAVEIEDNRRCQIRRPTIVERRYYGLFGGEAGDIHPIDDGPLRKCVVRVAPGGERERQWPGRSEPDDAKPGRDERASRDTSPARPNAPYPPAPPTNRPPAAGARWSPGATHIVATGLGDNGDGATVAPPVPRAPTAAHSQ